MTLTFSPIYKDNWEAQVKTRFKEGIEVKKAKQQAGNFLVKECLEREMGIKGMHLEEVMDQVVEIFPNNETDWKTLAVRFENTAMAGWIHRSLARVGYSTQPSLGADSVIIRIFTSITRSFVKLKIKLAPGVNDLYKFFFY